VFLHWAGDVDDSINGHQCLVAGLQADGRLIDWSDVRMRVDGRYVAYEQLWRDKHLQSYLRAREPHYGRPSTSWQPKVIHGGLSLELR
jgi:hypothetical protein